MDLAISRAPSSRDHRPSLSERRAWVMEQLGWVSMVEVVGGSELDKERARNQRIELEAELEQIRARDLVRGQQIRLAVILIGSAIILGIALIGLARFRGWV